MHTTDMDLSLEEITKIEGTAQVDIKIRDGRVTDCHFAITEMRRFFEEAVRGKSIVALPHLLARICGTCSNAHLMASIKSVENGLGITASKQTQLLRTLLIHGLMIRDHGLHLYVFVLPDLFNRESILAFDETDPKEDELLHDCFSVKEAGNTLSIVSGGRSVHAPNVAIGGFTVLPKKEDLMALIPVLRDIRPRVLRLIDVFLRCPFTLRENLKYLALTDPYYSFLTGALKTSDGLTIAPEDFEKNLECPIIPYSQAAGCLFHGSVHMVGALARMNLNRSALHPKTLRDAADAVSRFPSDNIFHNNLAQAIEMLHAIDTSIDLIPTYQGLNEKPATVQPKEAVGIGIIEAPRGILYHRAEMSSDGKITRNKVIVPTGENQIGIENSIRQYVSANLDKTKEELSFEIQKVIRAYDPCMSCATHFLTIHWN